MGEEVDKNWYYLQKLSQNYQQRFIYFKKEMLSNNTNIKNQFINIALTQQDITIAKSQFYPIINFNAGLNSSVGQLSTNDVNSPISSAASKNLNYYGNFTLNFKLYDGGKLREE